MYKRLVCTVLVALLVAVELTNPVKAAGLDWQFFSSNGIDFYDPTDICTDEEVIGAVQLAGDTNTERILNFFMTQMGLNLAQASAFVGNMTQESGLNPAIEQGGRIVDDSYVPVHGTGFGLVQWTWNERQKPLQDHIKQLGVGITDLGGQLSFVKKELEAGFGGTLRALRQTNDPVTAAVIVHGKARGDSSDPRYQQALTLLAGARGYEASDDTADDVLKKRGQVAQAAYDKYKDAPALAGSTAVSTSSQTGDATTTAAGDITPPVKADSCDTTGKAFGGGDLIETVKAYAHHQYSAARTDQTPAYTEAVNRALSEGRYVGGSGGGVRGNDCGGFVTTLVFDSGFDKGYNADAKGGNTVHQEAWLKQHWQPISATDAGDRLPGDVAVNGTHTYIYVGQVEGFETQIASASLDGPPRAPMAGKEGVADASFRWYRKKAGVSS